MNFTMTVKELYFNLNLQKIRMNRQKSFFDADKDVLRY